MIAIRDITERKIFEESLRDSEERFRRFAEVTTDGIVMHDMGVVLDINQAFADMLGYRVEEIRGRDGTFLVAPQYQGVLRKNIEGGYEKPYRAVFVRKDGSPVETEIHGKSAQYRGRTVRVACVKEISPSG